MEFLRFSFLYGLRIQVRIMIINNYEKKKNKINNNKTKNKMYKNKKIILCNVGFFYMFEKLNGILLFYL